MSFSRQHLSVMPVKLHVVLHRTDLLVSLSGVDHKQIKLETQIVLSEWKRMR